MARTTPDAGAYYCHTYKRGESMTPGQRQNLLHGTGEPFDTDDARRQAWQQHRAELICEAVAAGVMPAAWWEYDATEPRRIIRHGEYWLASKDTVRGVPVRHWIRPQFADDYGTPSPEYETERQYIERMGILG